MYTAFKTIMMVYRSKNVLFALLLLFAIPAPTQPCHTDSECSLAGSCSTNGTCICDGWTHGEYCEILNLLPANSQRYGYQNSSAYNSWGGASIEHNNKWYLFASQMAGQCPLLGWWSLVSQVVRGEAHHPMGPFENISVVVPSFAHNAKPFRSPQDGMWLIYYIGQENGETHRCQQHRQTNAPPQDDPGGKTAGPIMVAAADRPDAPAEEWVHYGPLTDSYDFHSATNPSPLLFQNGTVLLAVSRKFLSGGKRTVLMTSNSWKGPFRNITTTSTAAGSLATGEDPDLFQTPRGFHMLNHNTGPSSTRLWYSTDGVSDWQETSSLAKNAFNGTVTFDNGTVIQVCQRQRPQIVLHPEDGMPGWFWSGVMLPIDGFCPRNDLHPARNPTFTLVQAIGRSQKRL